MVSVCVVVVENKKKIIKKKKKKGENIIVIKGKRRHRKSDSHVSIAQIFDSPRRKWNRGPGKMWQRILVSRQICRVC